MIKQKWSSPMVIRNLLLTVILTSTSCARKQTGNSFDFTDAAMYAKSISVHISVPMSGEKQDNKHLRTGNYGTGTIVSSDGQILTNAHVVSGFDEVLVTLPDSRKFKATIIYVSSKQDLALLQIPVEGLTPAIFSRQSLRQGEWVLSAGFPLDERFSVTSGIVSALHIGNLHIAEIEDYIQLDTPLTKGYSGGPLLSKENEIVGLNTAVSSYTNNMSFAIPANLIKAFLMKASKY